jgi:hypothetical protein
MRCTKKTQRKGSKAQITQVLVWENNDMMIPEKPHSSLFCIKRCKGRRGVGGSQEAVLPGIQSLLYPIGR